VSAVLAEVTRGGLVERGAADAFGLTDEELAIACAPRRPATSGWWRGEVVAAPRERHAGAVATFAGRLGWGARGSPARWRGGR